MIYKQVFVDSDILLDVLLQREPFYVYGQQLLMAGVQEQVKLGTSALVIANVHYVLAKSLGKEEAKDKLIKLIGLLTVYPFNTEAIELALNSNFGDLEDAIQYFIALKNQCNAVITRNLKHYKKAQLPVITAEQFVKTYAN